MHEQQTKIYSVGRPTDQPTDRQTDRKRLAVGFVGKLYRICMAYLYTDQWENVTRKLAR